jgi:hypothetical protein
VTVHGRRVRVAVLPLLGALGACEAHLPPCPAAGGPVWTELEGTHFRLRTDASPADARVALGDLEQLEAALLTVFGAPPDLNTGKIPAVLVDRGWTDIVPNKVQGYFTYALFRPLVVMPAAGRANRQETIKHELVHYISRQFMPRQPEWLSEGLATYYQTIEYDADAGRITVGRPQPAMVRAAQWISVSNLTSMFATKEIGEDVDRFYAAAWITIHYLMNHRTAALAVYEKALHDGADPDAAWTSAFGSQTPTQLALDIRQYAAGGRYAMLSYRFSTAKFAAPVERRLSDADTHATRALLYVTGGRGWTGAADYESRSAEGRGTRNANSTKL